MLTDRSFHTVAAKVIIAHRAVHRGWAVVARATRYAAVWLAICFHVAIEFSADVEVFSFLAIAVLVIWAVPSARDRRLLLDPASRSVGSSRSSARLDWLARFRVVPGPPGSPIRIVDRDGRTTEGGPTQVFALSRLPVAASLALPLLLLPSVRGARRGFHAQRCVRMFSQELTSTPGAARRRGR